MNNDDVATTKFSTEYLKIILDFIKTTEESDSVQITLSKDYPIKVELTHYIIYLAPRVEN